ncbi:MAG: response regulator [Chloroflexi bacterium]|nr:response regulator [Chloroflexota bacterium]
MERKPKVLLIDDDADFVELATMVLSNHPYDICAAYSGDEGLQKAASEKPDVIVLDVVMPLKDGFTVCQQLKSDPDTANIPVIMLTGFRHMVSEVNLSVGQGLTLEADDYVEKPLNAVELLGSVSRQLRKVGF